MPIKLTGKSEYQPRSAREALEGSAACPQWARFAFYCPRQCPSAHRLHQRGDWEGEQGNGSGGDEREKNSTSNKVDREEDGKKHRVDSRNGGKRAGEAAEFAEVEPSVPSGGDDEGEECPREEPGLPAGVLQIAGEEQVGCEGAARHNFQRSSIRAGAAEGFRTDFQQIFLTHAIVYSILI